MRSRPFARAVAAVMPLIVLIAATAADRLPDSEGGRRVYTAGESASGGEITAALSADAAPMSAALLPCVNCHGVDGRGKPEGGVTPSNVTWLELTKPYSTEMPNGRRRPPYTEATVARAIRAGVDSANQPLNAAMPHYAMSGADMENLIAYLKVLGTRSGAGVTDNAIHLATIVPASGPGAILGAQVAAVLAAYFDEAGEIHGRKVTVTTVPLSSSAPVAAQTLQTMIEKDEPLAFVSGIVSGIDSSVERVVERDEVPLVLPITTHADSGADNRQRFYLYPSVSEQIAGLVKFAEDRLHRKMKRVVVVRSPSGDTPRLGAARDVIAIDASKPGATSKIAAEARRADAILFLEPRYPLHDLAHAVADTKPRAAFLFDGEVLPQDFFDAATSLPNAMVALPASPVDLTPEGLGELRGLLERHAIPRAHLASQLCTYTAAKLMAFALQKSGRDLTRETLRTSLERIYQFDTGISPPLSFGATRHIGSTRIDVATIDPVAKRLTPFGQFQVQP